MAERNLQHHKTTTSHYHSNMSDVDMLSGFILEKEKLTIPGLSELCVYSCIYNNDYYSKGLFAQLNITYPKHLRKAVSKRQAEYLAGRHSARLALRDVNVEDVNIATGPHRSPVWPQAVIGSITHTKHKAYAAVAHRTDFSYVGIDYEALINASTAKSIHANIADEHEMKLVMDAYGDFTLALTLIFSAKESLFKALYPHVGRYFDFSAASMINLAKEETSFSLRLNYSLTKNLTKGCCFKGRLYQETGHVFTVIAGSFFDR